ncbi:hypothetical protein BC628DRAFT_1094436 [Trametes gibbosa]|nr:hypothetical protein BC628DRAFT_1094436 [Trametes gibbosa]
MHFTFSTAFILALSGQAVLSTPVIHKTTTIGSTFPVHDLSSGGAHPNVTLARGGLHAETTASDSFASLLLCSTQNCISCVQIDLSTIPHNECFVSGLSNIASAAVSQADDSGLSFGTFIGQAGCVEFVQIPVINTCYNNNNSSIKFTDFALA